MAPLDRTPRSLAKVMARAVAKAVCVGAWTAAGELPVRPRRLARAGVLTAFVVFLSLVTPWRPTRAAVAADPPTGAAPREPGEAAETHEPDEPVDGADGRRSLGYLLARRFVVGLGWTVLVEVVLHRLERRWVARLTRAGHPRPHVAAGVRLGAAEFALTVTGYALGTYEGRQLAAFFESRPSHLPPTVRGPEPRSGRRESGV